MKRCSVCDIEKALDQFGCRKTGGNQVLTIRQMSRYGSTDTEIARRFGVTSTNIRSIRIGMSWKDVALLSESTGDQANAT